MKIIIAGGSGFIGSYLRHFFTQRGDQVFLLTRHPKQSGDIEWDPEKGKLDLRSLESDVVINLCGDASTSFFSDLAFFFKARAVRITYFCFKRMGSRGGKCEKEIVFFSEKKGRALSCTTGSS